MITLSASLQAGLIGVITQNTYDGNGVLTGSVHTQTLQNAEGIAIGSSQISLNAQGQIVGGVRTGTDPNGNPFTLTSTINPDGSSSLALQAIGANGESYELVTTTPTGGGAVTQQLLDASGNPMYSGKPLFDLSGLLGTAFTVARAAIVIGVVDQFAQTAKAVSADIASGNLDQASAALMNYGAGNLGGLAGVEAGLVVTRAGVALATGFYEGVTGEAVVGMTPWGWGAIAVLAAFDIYEGSKIGANSAQAIGGDLLGALESLFATPSSAGSPYNVLGRDANGNVDPSLASRGGETNTVTSGDGTVTTAHVAADGSATVTVTSTDGTTSNYTFNAAGLLTQDTTTRSDGSGYTQAFDTATNTLTLTSTQAGVGQNSIAIHQAGDGSIQTTTSDLASSGTPTYVDTKSATPTGSLEIQTALVNGVAVGQVAIDYDAEGRAIQAYVTGTQNNVAVNDAQIVMAAGSEATINGLGNLLEGTDATANMGEASSAVIASSSISFHLPADDSASVTVAPPGETPTTFSAPSDGNPASYTKTNPDGTTTTYSIIGRDSDGNLDPDIAAIGATKVYTAPNGTTETAEIAQDGSAVLTVQLAPSDGDPGYNVIVNYNTSGQKTSETGTETEGGATSTQTIDIEAGQATDSELNSLGQVIQTLSTNELLADNDSGTVSDTYTLGDLTNQVVIDHVSSDLATITDTNYDAATGTALGNVVTQVDGTGAATSIVVSGTDNVVAGGDTPITLNFAATAVVTGDDNVLTLANNTQVVVAGTGNILDGNSDFTGTVEGSGNTVNFGSGGTLTDIGGGNTVNSSGTDDAFDTSGDSPPKSEGRLRFRTPTPKRVEPNYKV